MGRITLDYMEIFPHNLPNDRTEQIDLILP